MNRSIEQIRENDRYVVSLAYNNTVALWEKLPPNVKADAHAYSSATRADMAKQLEAPAITQQMNQINHLLEQQRELEKRIERQLAEFQRTQNKKTSTQSETQQQQQQQQQKQLQHEQDRCVLDSARLNAALSSLKERESDLINARAQLETRFPTIFAGGTLIRRKEDLYDKNGPYLKSLLFKYPPSIVYLFPGDQLLLIVGMVTGKILVWELLNNHILKGHTQKVTHCVGLKRNDDSLYLVTASSGDTTTELFVWDLTPGVEQVHHVKHPVARAMLDGPLINLLYSETTGYIVTEREGSLDFWHPWSLTFQREMKPIHTLALPVVCVTLDSNRNLFYVGLEDGSVQIYFQPTCQHLASMRPTLSSQYYRIIDICANATTFAVFDSYCIHWRNLGFSYQTKT
eukprot:TRINITY_DN2675_c0_g1_i7.p1 TRINITY_DN2675_c0_g1~~TRINITY_DN2675_c0_g1_i7.p1  ORF type:complete len:401 (-),score=88.55 TRINITY_DN2675_c0_g1_i7:143-1345(-)